MLFSFKTIILALTSPRTWMNISPIIRGHQKNCFLVYSISHIGRFQKPLKNSSDFGFNLACLSFTMAMSSHPFSAVYLHQSCVRFTFKILIVPQNFKTFAKYLTNSEFLKIVNVFKMSSFTLFSPKLSWLFFTFGISL